MWDILVVGIRNTGIEFQILLQFNQMRLFNRFVMSYIIIDCNSESCQQVHELSEVNITLTLLRI